MCLFQQLMLLLVKACSFVLKLLMTSWALINVEARASLQSCLCGAGLGFGLMFLGWQQWGLGASAERRLLGAGVSLSPQQKVLPQLTSVLGY